MQGLQVSSPTYKVWPASVQVGHMRLSPSLYRLMGGKFCGNSGTHCSCGVSVMYNSPSFLCTEEGGGEIAVVLRACGKNKRRVKV